MSNDNHQPDYVIRKKRTAQWYWSWAGVVLMFLLAAMALGYWLNQKQHSFSGTAKQQFVELQEKQAQTHADMIHWKQQYEVESQVTQQLQKDISEQQREVVNLKKELQALQRIFDPDGVDSGLQIASFVWNPLSETHYAYRLMLIQAKQQSLAVTGSFNISIIGTENSEPKSYEFTEIAGLDEQNSKFKFKYAQSFPGTFKLPIGFQPRFIRVIANGSGRNAVSRLQDFEWQQIAIEAEPTAEKTTTSDAEQDDQQITQSDDNTN